MKTKSQPLLFILLAFLAFSAINPPFSTAFAQNVIFNYQINGLMDNGVPFTGEGAFQFALVTAVNSSQQATATVGSVQNGIITSYNINAEGNGYTTAPTVTIVGVTGASGA